MSPQRAVAKKKTPQRLKVERVIATSEARKNLSATTKRFREKGAKADPVVYGNQRNPDGVIMSYALYEELMSLVDDMAIVDEVAPRLAAEGPDISFEDGLAQLGIELPASED